MVKNSSPFNCGIIKFWLITRKWMWKKVVFDNGIVGKNYHRYDHRLYPYTWGMGDNGEHGGAQTAIKNQLDAMRNGTVENIGDMSNYSLHIVAGIVMVVVAALVYAIHILITG